MEPLITDRLFLRRFRENDGEALFAYLSDPEVVRFEPYEPFTRESAEQEAARRAFLDRGFQSWGVRRVVAMCNPVNENSWRRWSGWACAGKDFFRRIFTFRKMMPESPSGRIPMNMAS